MLIQSHSRINEIHEIHGHVQQLFLRIYLKYETRLSVCLFRMRFVQMLTLKMAVSRSTFVLLYLSMIPVVKYNILSNA